MTEQSGRIKKPAGAKAFRVLLSIPLTKTTPWLDTMLPSFEKTPIGFPARSVTELSGKIKKSFSGDKSG